MSALVERYKGYWVEIGLMFMAIMAMVLFAGNYALGAQSTELSTAINTAATEVESNIMAILPQIVAVAALLLVINVAWKFFRRFVR